jgi:hypothetical protein
MFSFVKKQTEKQYAGITQLTVSCLFIQLTHKKTRKNKLLRMESKGKKPTENAPTSASKEVKYAV